MVGLKRRPVALRDRERHPRRERMSNGSVLVVDDEPNIALSLEYLMREQGFEVRVARDGEAAIAALQEARPDVVLLDVMMPGKDGYEVCQLIRATPEWKDVRVIMLTAKGRSIEQEKGLALGADDYITKPFSTRTVVERVQQYMTDRTG
jgi:DNA-binding response OmpR family regulator